MIEITDGVQLDERGRPYKHYTLRGGEELRAVKLTGSAKGIALELRAGGQAILLALWDGELCKVAAMLLLTEYTTISTRRGSIGQGSTRTLTFQQDGEAPQGATAALTVKVGGTTSDDLKIFMREVLAWHFGG